MAGYSGTPLAKKLGIKQAFKIKALNAPDNYSELLSGLPEGAKFLNDTKTKKDLIHYFTKSAVQLKKDLPALRDQLDQNGCIWISWPKKALKIETDLNENSVRDLALKNKLVDVKAAAIDSVWSGLKLVIRLKDREK